ncbi:MAG TPA: molybdopterin cofactor-binding domain-containing protein [Candidatus Sulfotelmatobacter sp.]|nr:molybdopterin cofactor-binding domain-containing protein [Candidatus Sulfotelmatobacter sp.]
MVDFHINGRPARTAAAPATPLISVLRDEMHLTGTKLGCDDGRCGTCMVLVNGRVARACRTPVGEVAGASVLTIEGLGTPERLHPLQRAFVETGAIQCGFCAPGMIVAAKGLLDADPRPSRAAIVKALGADYCRCTGYATIFEAVERAAAVLRGEPVPPPALPLAESWDEIAKATGRAQYGADLLRPGMLHLKVVRSPHAHARVLRLDTGAAAATPGVAAVFTAKDVPSNLHGRMMQDQPVLVEDTVRMLGDPVAAVAAETESIAAAAAAKVRVEYEVLPPLTSPEASLRPGAPRLHPLGNVLKAQTMGKGDVAAGFAQAGVVVEGSYRTPFNEHAYLEPEAGLAYVDEDGRLVLHSATPHTHLHQREVARVLGLPRDRVKVLPLLVGGAFGGKSDLTVQALVGLAAWRLRRPVKHVLTREESFQISTKRHPFAMRCRLGADAAGRLTALEMDILADAGPYASSSEYVVIKGMVSAAGPYDIPNSRLFGRSVRTHNAFAGSMRGLGAPQTTFAAESQVDEVARRLRMHPIDLRLKNALRPGCILPTGFQVGDEVAYRETLEAIRPHYDAAVARARADGGGGPVRRGVGVASMWYGIGTTLGERPSHADAALLPSGQIALHVGGTDTGQGSDFALRRIGAMVFGVPVPSVVLVRGDTDRTRDTGSATGSRTTFYIGNAARIAAENLRGLVLQAAAEILEAPAEILECRDGHVFPREAPGRGIGLADLARRLAPRGIHLKAPGTFDPEAFPLDSETGLGKPFATYASATHMAEVEVNLRTGAVRVRRMVAAHDVGRVINPAGARCQVEGAIAMGIGFALKEEFVPGVTRGFADYHIPTTRDMPEIETIFIERPEPRGPFGAKGLGECALLPTAPAVLNAVADATGARIYELPATRARILAAIAAAPHPSSSLSHHGRGRG